jgi:hypothetical protein
MAVSQKSCMWLSIAVLAGSQALLGVAADTRLQSSDEVDRQGVVQELQRQRASRAEELRAIDAQLQRIQRANNTGFGGAARMNDQNGRIVNGVSTVSFPSVGALLRSYPAPDGTFRLTTWCTGTLIGSRTFVTAAHCIVEDRTPAKYRVFLQHAGLFGVKAIEYQDSLYSFPKADVAIVQLEDPVDGIRVQPVTDRGLTERTVPAVIVGFGRTGGKSLVYGIKRTGYVKTSDCTCAMPACREPGELICWKYDALIANPGLDSNTCNADSGGPLLLERTQGQALQLIGTTSGGTRADCFAHDESYDLSVFKYHDWVTRVAGDDLGVSGAAPLVGEVGAVVQAAGGRFDDQTTRQSFTLTVASGARRMVVAMNGDDTLSADNRFTLELQQPGNAGEPQCAQRDNVQFKACRIANPVPGEWRVTVTAERGAGDFQLVSTIFR